MFSSFCASTTPATRNSGMAATVCLLVPLDTRKEGSKDSRDGEMAEKKQRKRQEVLTAKKNHVLYNPACAQIKIEMAFKLENVIIIN